MNVVESLRDTAVSRYGCFRGDAETWIRWKGEGDWVVIDGALCVKPIDLVRFSGLSDVAWVAYGGCVECRLV